VELINKTSFAAERTVLLDRDGIETLLVVVKATYSMGADNKLSVAEEQMPIQMADEFYGKPGISSIKYESDLALVKNRTDIALIGHAYAQKSKTRRVDVTLRVGQLTKKVRIFGDRVWKKLGVYYKSSPIPFEKMPLVYERAFGGADLTNKKQRKQGYETRNPVGTGYRIKYTKKIKGTKLPNLEDPRKTIKKWKDHPEPAGFGFIGRDWEPRLGYAGTYDEKWFKTRSPLLPSNFNELYFQGAHKSLITKGFLRGDEAVEGRNLSANGYFSYKLPGVTPDVLVKIGNKEEKPEMRLDTLILEPDINRVMLVWRGKVKAHRQLYDVKSIQIDLELLTHVTQNKETIAS